jgi:hypothetical protein
MGSAALVILRLLLARETRRTTIAGGYFIYTHNSLSPFEFRLMDEAPQGDKELLTIHPGP